MKRLSLFSFLGIILCANTVFATPSNIIKAPSADIQPFGTFHLGIDNNTTMFLPKKSGGASMPTDFGITTGIFDAGALVIEMGLDVREPTNDPFSLNFKVAVPEGAISDIMPAVFFGGYDIGTNKDKTDYNIIYGGVSKTFSFIGRFTFGYFFGNEILLRDSQGRTDNNAIIFAYDTRLPNINERLWFGIDFMGTNSQYGAVSFGFSWSFSENAALTIGFIRFNDERVTPKDINDNVIGKNLVTWQVDFDF